MKTLEQYLTEKNTRRVDDNDLYKFSMMWAVMDHFPDAKVRYEFVSRPDKSTGKPKSFPENFGANLRKRIQNQSDIYLTDERVHQIKNKCPYLPQLYMDFLKGYRFDSSEVSITQYGDQLQIVIQGYWYRTILWEVYLLSEISELYYLITNQISEMSDDQLKQRNGEKGTFFRMNDIQFADFGTRRRYSYDNQKNVIGELKSYGGSKFVGTSNLSFAIDYGIKAIGTYAHEWVSGIAAIMGYKHANRYAMELWSKTYGGNLGIALTDTYGLDAFLQDFDLKYAKLFDGVRQDSADPIVFADKIIEHYNKLNIDPIKFNKTIVFSDALNPSSALKIADYCRGKIHTSFGIGTNLTNDIPGIEPLNIVIKLFSINGSPAIKLSDVEGKHTGDPKTIEIIKDYINYKPL